MKLMRKLYVAAVLCLAAPFFVRAAEVVLMEEIVAKVNGDIITAQGIETPPGRTCTATINRR